MSLTGLSPVTLEEVNLLEEKAHSRSPKPARWILFMGLFGFFSSLFGTSCSKKTIHSEFINARDGTVIAVSELPPAQLPETFAVDTTLDMSGKKWSVERAEPQDKTDILKAGKVRVHLTPITMMPTSNILFSLPTISDDMGVAAGDSLPSSQIFALHEDDWRQVEFIAQDFAAEIEAELADIRRIYQEQRSGGGFKNVHIRKRIPSPLEKGKLTLRELEAEVTPQKKFHALGFHRARGTVSHGFAWELDEHCVLWGVTNPEGLVTRLCLLGKPELKTTSLSEAFAQLNTQHRLTFVDWCRQTKVGNDTNAFRAYLEHDR